jgi:hypothetical protein
MTWTRLCQIAASAVARTSRPPKPSIRHDTAMPMANHSSVGGRGLRQTTAIGPTTATLSTCQQLQRHRPVGRKIRRLLSSSVRAQGSGTPHSMQALLLPRLALHILLPSQNSTQLTCTKLKSPPRPDSSVSLPGARFRVSLLFRQSSRPVQSSPPDAHPGN